MRPAQHFTNNSTLLPPPGVSHEACQALPITRIHYDTENLDAVESYWQPTEAERAALAAGAKVRFHCWGRTHPPIWIGVDGVAPE